MAGRSIAAVVAVLAAVAVPAGCGGGGHGRGGMVGGGGMMGGGGMPPGASPGTVPTATSSAGSAGRGKALFLASGCGGCHTLAAAGTTGSAGPNLDQAHPSYERVVRQVADGGGAMPGFSGSLSRAQIDAIARYVADSAR